MSHKFSFKYGEVHFL